MLEGPHDIDLILGLLNLFIFFQSADLASRLASISVVALALFALIPTIIDQVPAI